SAQSLEAREVDQTSRLLWSAGRAVAGRMQPWHSNVTTRLPTPLWGSVIVLRSRRAGEKGVEDGPLFAVPCAGCRRDGPGGYGCDLVAARARRVEPSTCTACAVAVGGWDASVGSRVVGENAPVVAARDACASWC